MSGRVAALVVLLLSFAGCGTVNPGQDFEFAQITYDQNYFYCAVEPMLFARKCGPGDTSKGDPNSGCHYNVTSFRLSDHDPVPCDGNVPVGLQISAEAQGNYTSASGKMSPDPSRAPLLLRPTKQAAHPRQIFETKSTEADVIRAWATKYTSQ